MDERLIYKYFPALTEKQKEQFKQLNSLYREWNEKINVISRKDIDSLYLHHVLHSLAIARVVRFVAGNRIMDVGTGGGFPGIPLAILFPEASFYLIDSIGKKIRVVQGVVEALGLQNVKAEQIRVEQVKEKFDFIVSRAVTAFPDFLKLIRHKIAVNSAVSPNPGLLYLKGGDFNEEVRPFQRQISVYPIADFFEEDFFETKKVIYYKP